MTKYTLDPAVADKIKNIPTDPTDGRPISPQYWFGEDNENNPVDAHHVNNTAAWEAFDAATKLWELQHPEVLAAEAAAQRVEILAGVAETFKAAQDAADDLRAALGDIVGEETKGPTIAFLEIVEGFNDALDAWRVAVKDLATFDEEHAEDEAEAA
jgi:hypothetical protein